MDFISRLRPLSKARLLGTPSLDGGWPVAVRPVWRGFTLLVLAESDCELSLRAQKEAEDRFIPLKIVHIHGAELMALYQAPLALIRPDQIVAWRGHEWHDGLLDIVSGRCEQQTVRCDAELSLRTEA